MFTVRLSSLLVLLCFLCTCVLVDGSDKKATDILNTCLSSKHHKTQPGPEDNLFKCSAWLNNSCCTNYTAQYVHGDGQPLYNLNFSHCAPMSDKCRNHFTNNNCFYECSPYLGPWITPQKVSYRHERMYKVPLCASQCNAWWQDCKDESTCVENWSTGFRWDKIGNHCPKNTVCRPFTNVYHNASHFCETVWGPDDFVVTPDHNYCMKISFTGPNPNVEVAYHYALKKHLIKGTAIPPYSEPPKIPPLQVQGTIFSVVIGSIIIIVVIGLLIFVGLKRYRGTLFHHQGVPMRFRNLLRSSRQSAMVTRSDPGAEMSFMQYEEEEEEDAPEMNGSLRLDL
ncbi:folate receptor gamma [Ciona intestinalis]